VDNFWDLPFDVPVPVIDAHDFRHFKLDKLPADDTWLLPYIAAPSFERTGFPTQKPLITS
jgi:hypothetical protein